MNKIEENKFRGRLSKVFVQNSHHRNKHSVYIIISQTKRTGENIDIQGAYDLEIESVPNGTRLKFKMSKE